MNWENTYKDKLVTIDEVAAVIKSGDFLCFPGGESAPIDLMKAIDVRIDQLENIKIISGLLNYPYEFLKKKYKDNIRYYSIFMGQGERDMYPQGTVNLIVNQFSKLHKIISKKVNRSVALFECSEPDANGYMSYGPMGGVTNEYFKSSADTILVQINKKTPYLCGTNAHIHVDEVDYICEKSHDLTEFPSLAPGDDEKQIAAYIAEHIDDGATIQLGIGNIADAVGSLLETKNDIGIHTEMFTNSMAQLVKKGVVTGARKNFHKNKILISFARGDRQLYEFIDNNEMIEARPVSYVNNPVNISRNDNLISINGTMAVDLTGQVCSESVGFNQYSGTGGQLDFVRGALNSKGGKSFIALKSAANTRNGRMSKICCALPPGTAVTVPRTDVQYIVTEYGIADLWGQDIQGRVKSMISIAHPDFRE